MSIQAVLELEEPAVEADAAAVVAVEVPELPELERLSLARSPDEVVAERLRRQGLRQVARIETHTNRTVMVSLTPSLVLRLHRGYAWAPDRVLQAIVRFLNPRLPRALRRAAERILLDFPVERHAPAPNRMRRVDRPRPGDGAVVERLLALHLALNDRHFDGVLHTIPIRLSGRMRTRLGELSADRRTGRPIEIAIGRRHLERHGWDAVEETLLHEMVHQWQAETGRSIDHGTEFRRKAHEVGIEARAVRILGTGPLAERLVTDR